MTTSQYIIKLNKVLNQGGQSTVYEAECV